MSVETLASRLPNIETVERWSVSLAMLDAILQPEWEMRCFSFDRAWSVDERNASMRNGSGDEYSIVFGPAGACIRGFDHESALSPWSVSPCRVVPGIRDALPDQFQASMHDPASVEDDILMITVCLWRQLGDDGWSFGTPTDPTLAHEDGGAGQLFRELDGCADTYAAFARECFEQETAPADIDHILAHRPLSPELILRLNPTADVDAVRLEAQQIGYGQPDLDASSSS